MQTLSSWGVSGYKPAVAVWWGAGGKREIFGTLKSLACAASLKGATGKPPFGVCK